MKTDTLLYAGGCAGSFAAPSEDRPHWDPESAPWGIRRETFTRQRYGGRTTNYFLRHKNTFILVDHGLGVEPSSELLLDMLQHEQRAETNVSVVQTHYHMDHIHGTPQNQALYRKGIHFRYFSPDLSLYRPNTGGAAGTPFSMENIVGAYFRPSGEYFPVPIHALPSTREHVLFRLGEVFSLPDDILVETISLRHPGGCCGYRFEIPGCGRVVIATDYEPAPDPDPGVVDFFDGARLLVADMQYDDKEYAGSKAIGRLRCPRIGWGHGTPRRLFPTILACKHPPLMVRIVHHDPRKSDTDLDLFYEHSRDVLHELTGSHALPFDYQFARGGDAYWL